MENRNDILDTTIERIDSFTLRELSSNDVEDIVRLQDLVSLRIEDVDIFSTIDLSLIEKTVAEKNLSFGLFDEKKLIATCLFSVPDKDDPENMGSCIGLDRHCRGKVIHYETSFVHPQYRNLGLHRRLSRYSYKELAKKEMAYVIGTIAPYNYGTLKAGFDEGIIIKKVDEFYGGKMRLVFVYHYPELSVSVEEDMIIHVDMKDFERQKNLIDAGFCGCCIRGNFQSFEIGFAPLNILT